MELADQVDQEAAADDRADQVQMLRFLDELEDVDWGELLRESDE